MSFKENSEVLIVDLMGEQLTSKKIRLEEGDIYYFNNTPLKKSQAINPSLPLGLPEYNHLRELNAKRKIQLYKKKNKFSSTELLKLMSTPLHCQIGKKEKLNPDDETFETLTLSSLQSVVMNPFAEEIQMIPGLGPKLFKGEILHLKQIFTKLKQSPRSVRGPKPSLAYQNGLTHYARAQSAIDSHQWHGAYHHLQMGMAFFQGHHLYDYGRFFYTVLEYMTETNTLLRAKQLKEFIDLKERLSPYLADLCVLYINRLERILGRPSRFHAKDVTHPELKKVFRLEQKVPTPMLYKATTLIMAPRLDIRDVVQGGFRP